MMEGNDLTVTFSDTRVPVSLESLPVTVIVGGEDVISKTTTVDNSKSSLEISNLSRGRPEDRRAPSPNPVALGGIRSTESSFATSQAMPSSPKRPTSSFEKPATPTRNVSGYSNQSQQQSQQSSITVPAPKTGSRPNSRCSSVSSSRGVSPDRNRPRTPMHLRRSSRTGSLMDLAKEVSAITQAQAAAEAASKITFLPPSIPAAGRRVRVVVPHHEDLRRVWLQLVENDKAVLDLMEKIRNMYSSCDYGSGPSILPRPAVGDCCVAKGSVDQQWARAVVEEIKGDLAKIRFVDLGYSDELSLGHLRVPNSESAKDPILLLGPVSLIPGDEVTPTKANEDAFRRLLHRQLNFDLEVSKKMLSSAAKLFTVEGADVLNEIGLVHKTELPVFATHSLPLNAVRSTYLSSYISPNVFYIQFSECEADNEDIMEKLRSQSSNFEAIPSIEVGMPVAVKFSQDNEWYRGEVRDKRPENCFQVNFVDYGNSENVPGNFDRIRALPEEMLKYPVNSTMCKLDNVAPTGDGWTAEAKKELEKLIDGAELFIRFNSSGLSYRAGSAHAMMYGVLIGTKSGSDDVNQDFIKSGHARRLD